MQFGTQFSRHMVTMAWTPGRGWEPPELKAYGPLDLEPASAVFHYGQEILEGLKAYRHPDGSIWTFRPFANAERFRRSADRMAMPDLPASDFVQAIGLLVDADRDDVPSGAEESLYLRPFMYGSEAFLGVRPAQRYTFCLIGSPAGAYFRGGLKPVSIWLSLDYSRAGRFGTGDAKAGANYAASLLPQQEALRNGCDQVCFVDDREQKYVQEFGASNVFFSYADGRLVTPELDGAILEGITRDAVITLAREYGLAVEERPISVDEWRSGVSSGEITEVFACGTAAAITPVGRLKWNGGEVAWGTERPGPITERLRGRLLDIQYGRAADNHGWMHRIEPNSVNYTSQRLGTVLP
ncbi:branched-chain amino acid aminotransferase [Flindersiella endophytica]